MITYVTQQGLYAELIRGEGARSFGLAADVASRYASRYGEQAFAGSPDEGPAGPIRATDLGIAMLCALTNRVGLDARSTLSLLSERGNAFNDLVASTILDALELSWRPSYSGQSIALLAILSSRVPLTGRFTLRDVLKWKDDTDYGPYKDRWMSALGTRSSSVLNLEIAFSSLRIARTIRRADDGWDKTREWELVPWSWTHTSLQKLGERIRAEEEGL